MSLVILHLWAQLCLASVSRMLFSMCLIKMTASSPKLMSLSLVILLERTNLPLRCSWKVLWRTLIGPAWFTWHPCGRSWRKNRFTSTWTTWHRFPAGMTSSFRTREKSSWTVNTTSCSSHCKEHSLTLPFIDNLFKRVAHSSAPP